jgi:hypothetical protein
LGSCGGTGAGWEKDYYNLSLVVNGTGGATDRLDVAFHGTYYYPRVDLMEEYIMYANSSNSGANWGIPATLDTIDALYESSFYYVSINSLGTNIYVSYSDYSDIHFQNNSNNGIGSWTTTLLDSNNLVNYPSIAINNNSQPCVFWQNSSTTSLPTDLFYRTRNSTAWDTQQQMTTDGKNNTYVNTRYNYYSSGIDVLWTNGSTATKSITYSLLNCTYTEAGGAPPAEEYHPVMDVGDPLYCSIPSITGDVNTEIQCMPKSNTTGQPLTGLTVNCQANAPPLYTGTIQAASACGERSYGVYNWTLLASNVEPATSYTVNCSTVINTVSNGFAGSIYVMPDFTTSCASTADVVNSGSNYTGQILGNMSNNFTAVTALIAYLDGNMSANFTYIDGRLALVLDNLTLVLGNESEVKDLINSLENLTAQEIWEYAERTMTDYNQSGMWDNMTYIQELINSLANVTPEDIWGPEYPERVTNCSNCTGGVADINYSKVWSDEDAPVRNLTYYEGGGSNYTYYQNLTYLNQTHIGGNEITGTETWLNFHFLLFLTALGFLAIGVGTKNPVIIIASGSLFIILGLLIYSEGIPSGVSSIASTQNYTYSGTQLQNLTSEDTYTYSVWKNDVSGWVALLITLFGVFLMAYPAFAYLQNRER